MAQHTFTECFSRPKETLRRLSQEGVIVRDMLWVWGLFFFVAVFGSLFYGASMALVFPSLEFGKGALLILLSAGLGWFVFGPMLLVASKAPLLLVAHACMVTMSYGEAVLAGGAVGNFFLWLTGLQPSLALPWNILSLLVGNVAMAAALASQLRELGVPWRTTLLAWLIGLNGSGAFFFWLFSRAI